MGRRLISVTLHKDTYHSVQIGSTRRKSVEYSYACLLHKHNTSSLQPNINPRNVIVNNPKPAIGRFQQADLLSIG